MSRRPFPETTLRGHTGEAQSLAFANDDQLLICGDSAGVVRVWDLETARTRASVNAHSEDAGVLQVRAQGTNIITQGRDGEVCLWDLDRDSSLQHVRSVFKAEWYHFCKCCVPRCATADELHAHTIVAAGMDNKGAQIVDWRNGRAVLHCKSKDDHGITMCIDVPDMNQPTALAGTEGGHTVCWDLRKPQDTLASLKIADGPVFAIDCTRAPQSTQTRVQGTPTPAEAETPRLRVICGGAYRHLVCLGVDVAKGTMDCTMKLELPEEGVGDVSMRLDNRIVAAGCWDSLTRIFHVRTGKKLAALQQHRASIAAVEFSGSGLLACASRDKSISLWNINLSKQN